MRGARPRTWIKLHVNGMLNGSVRYQLTPAQRSVWVDLLVLAALGPTPGIIADNDHRPYPLSFIANRLNCPLNLVQKTISQCQQEGRITITENGIIINNWTAYQSEYERQRPYRQEKLQGDLLIHNTKVTPEVTNIVAESYPSDKNRIEVDKSRSRTPPFPPNEATTTTTTTKEMVPDTGDTGFASICKTYEAEIGMLTPYIGEEFKTLIADSPNGQSPEQWAGWICKAIEYAANQNKRNLAYILATLKGWQSQGWQMKKKEAINGKGLTDSSPIAQHLRTQQREAAKARARGENI